MPTSASTSVVGFKATVTLSHSEWVQTLVALDTHKASLVECASDGDATKQDRHAASYLADEVQDLIERLEGSATYSD